MALREVVDNEVHYRREFGWSIKVGPSKRQPVPEATILQTTTPLEVVDYDSLLRLLRARADELQISRETLNDIAGLASGHAGKILGMKQIRRIGMLSLGPLLDALALKLIPIQNEAALERNRKHYVRRDEAHFRSASARYAPKPVEAGHSSEEISMALNDYLPPAYHPDTATALLTLASAISDPKKLQEILDQFAAFDRRTKEGQAKLESDRATFAAEKQKFRDQQSRDQEQHQKKMANEYQEHLERMANAEQEIARRDEESRRKWSDLSKEVTAGLC